MSVDRTDHHDGAPLDREQGRTDPLNVLRIRLATAPSEYLAGALDNAALGREEIDLVLGNRSASIEILTRVGRNRVWMRAREAKLGLVSHPGTPFALARTFLPHLFWRELGGLASNLRVSPALRREAEKLVRLRLPELTLGERVALARVASRGLVESLRDETDGAVLTALACNPRATEFDLERILARADLPATFLGWLADQSSWGQRRAVRLAVVRHPLTPRAAALRVVRTLSRRDLDDLSRDDAVPRLVRVAAERRIGGRSSGRELPRASPS